MSADTPVIDYLVPDGEVIMENFLLGDILLSIDYGGMPVISEGNLQLFRCDAPWQGDSAALQCVFEDLKPYKAQCLQRDNFAYGVYSHDGEKILLYHWGNLFHGFAVRPERFSVSFCPEMHSQPPLREDWFFSVCGFHRQLLRRDACVLHSSYVDIGGQAVLFTGPSNVGKSTQADLWTRHAGARIINGDRTLLRMRDGVWNAFGYPCAGTSGICRNETMPVRAIVVLAQAESNWVEQISPSRKIRALASAMELYPWEEMEIGLALSIAQKVASGVPVVKLHCRPDGAAVDVLRNYLEENVNGSDI